MENDFNQVINVGYVINFLLMKIKKVRDQDNITGKFWSYHKMIGGSAHSDYNINLKLTKKVNVIFHNLRGYDSNLIMQEIGKFDVKVNVKSNRLEKYMAITINKNLVFIAACNLEILV